LEHDPETQGENHHGEEAQSEEEGRKIEEARRAGPPPEIRVAQARPQGEGEEGRAEAPQGPIKAAAAEGCTERAAADEYAGSRGHPNCAAAVAIPVVGAG
jgi:hypothetical protein